MRKFFLSMVLCLFWAGSAAACDSTHAALSREAGVSSTAGEGPAFFADFSVEQMKWDRIPAHEAHALHHDGHHVHVKTHEEFYHVTVGAAPVDRLTVLASIPYVVRGSVETHSHARLGRRESSEGWGDLRLNGIWRFVQEDSVLLGWLAGVKLPTGDTEERNSGGVLFEPELQPGTGSTDATLGLVASGSWGPLDLRGNLRYTWSGKNGQDFRFGDVLAFHLSAGKTFGSSGAFRTKLALDIEGQAEARQSENGTRIEDSGGETVLAGPSIEIGRAGWTIFGNVLLPVYQNPGGVHQELDFVWNAGVKTRW